MAADKYAGKALESLHAKAETAGQWVSSKFDDVLAGSEKDWDQANLRGQARLDKEQIALEAYANKLGLEDKSKLPPRQMKDSILGLEPGSRALAGEITMGYKFFGKAREFWRKKQAIREAFQGEQEVKAEVAKEIAAQTAFEKFKAEAPVRAERVMAKTRAWQEHSVQKDYIRLFDEAEKRFPVLEKIQQGTEGTLVITAQEFNQFFSQAEELGIEIPKLNIQIVSGKERHANFAVAA